MFNVVVDNVTQTWLALTVEDQWVSLDGVGENFNLFLGVFNANDGMVRSIDYN